MLNNRLVTSLAFALTLLNSSGHANATSLSEAFSAAYIFLGNTNSAINAAADFGYNGQVADTGEFASSFSGLNSQGLLGTTSYYGRAYSQTTPGLMKTYAYSMLINPQQNPSNPLYYSNNIRNTNGMPDIFDAIAESYFSDTITLQNAENVSYVYIDISMEGVINKNVTSPPTLISSYASLSQVDNSSTYTRLAVASTNGNYNLSLTSNRIQVDGGIFYFGLRLIAESEFHGLNFFGNWIEGGNYFGEVDFSNTVTVLGIRGFDSMDNPVSIGGALGASGASYDTLTFADPTTAIPEPDILLMMTTCCTGLILSKRSKRSAY